MGYPSNITQGVPKAYQGNGVFVSDPAYDGGGWTSYPARGTQYDYAQLQRIWLDAGGSPQLAPTMAAIAGQVESGGWNGAWNSTGATGLWQIEWPSSAPPGWSREMLFNPLDNAKAAVRLSGNNISGVQSNWSGDLSKIRLSSTPPAKSYPPPKGLNGVPGGGVSTMSSSSGGSAQTTSLITGVGSALSAGSGILHGTALWLDRFAALGAPGQGWRIAFGLGGIAAGAGAYKAFTSGDDEGEGNLPLSIALLGVASVCAFMTLRRWPQAGGRAIKPGAYLVDIATDRIPPAGPSGISPTEVDLTETFLGGLVGLWAAAKAARAVSAGTNAVSGILGDILGYLGLRGAGSGGGGGVGEVPPVPEVPA